MSHTDINDLNKKKTYQISNIGDLNGIVNYFGTCATITFFKHCLINDNCCFNIFSCFTNVPFKSSATIRMLQFVVIGSNARYMLLTPWHSPFHVTGICTTFICFSTGFKNYMRVFLLKQIFKSKHLVGIKFILLFFWEKSLEAGKRTKKKIALVLGISHFLIDFQKLTYLIFRLHTYQLTVVHTRRQIKLGNLPILTYIYQPQYIPLNIKTSRN